MITPDATLPHWDWESLRRRCFVEARRYLPGPDAEDATQEALMRGWRRRATCGTPADPLPWLLAITRREALRRLARNGEALVEAPVDGSDTRASEEIEAAPERMDVRAALGQLGAEDVALLNMRYAEDLTQPAVAKVLGVPEGTVKVRLHRLRRRLEEMLVEQ